MGSRGPVPRKRMRGAQTADGVRLKPLPADSAAIFRRLAKDIPALSPADAGLLELQAYWLEIAKEARRQLDAEQPGANGLALTVTDTAHGDGTESRKNPLLIVLRTATEQVRAIAQQLGASPAARARLPEPEREQMSLADILFADVDAARHE